VLLLRFAVRQLIALFGENAKRPERIFSVRDKLFPHRRNPPIPQKLVQLLLRAALPVRRNLDEFKWHTSFFEKYREQGLRPYNSF